MAETKVQPQKELEREYVIPLRKAFLKVPRYERTRIAIRTIKRFIARHMKVPDKDLKKVKLDVYFNNEIWFRGRKKPPAKINVRATKEGDIVKVYFVEIPEHVKFIKQKVEKRYKLPEKKPEKAEEVSEEIKAEEKTPEKTEEQKTEEKEKAQAVAQQHEKQAEMQAKAQKHLTKKKEPGFHRMALKK